MAGEKMLLLSIGSDRDGEVFMDHKVTLRDLLDACRTAEESFFPLDAEIQYGWVHEQLAMGIYVEKPIDCRSLPFEDLKQAAVSSSSPADQTAAWAEIRRRALAMPGGR